MSPDTPKKRKADLKPSSMPTKRARGDRERELERDPKREGGGEGGTTPNPQKNALLGPHEDIIASLSVRNDVLAASVISSTRIGKRTTYITSHLLRPSDHTESAAADTEKAAAVDTENATAVVTENAATAAENAATSTSHKPRLALLHARPADVCKMITIAELCKRTLDNKGLMWYQYNQTFELPEDLGRIQRSRLPRGAKDAAIAQQRKQKKKKHWQQVLRDKERDPNEVPVVLADDDIDDDEEEEDKDEGDEDEDEDEDEDAFEPAPSRFESAVLKPERATTRRSLRIFLSLEPIAELRAREDVTTQRSVDGTISAMQEE